MKKGELLKTIAHLNDNDNVQILVKPTETRQIKSIEVLEVLPGIKEICIIPFGVSVPDSLMVKY